MKQGKPGTQSFRRSLSILVLLAAMLLPALLFHAAQASVTKKDLADFDKLYECCKNMERIVETLKKYYEVNKRYPLVLEEIAPSFYGSFPCCPVSRTDTYSPSHKTAGGNPSSPKVDEIIKYKTPREEPLKACCSNLKTLGTECEMFSADNKGRYPTALAQLTPDYLRTIPTCPAAGRDTYSQSYRSTAAPVDRYTIYCQGRYHVSEGARPDYPRHDAENGLTEK